MFLRRILRRPQDNAFVEKQENYFLSMGMDAGFLGLLDVGAVKKMMSQVLTDI